MWSESPSNPQDALQRLLDVMARLRDKEHGCPWDVKQTMASLTRYTIEEAYEAVDAIMRNDTMDIKDELGDLLFQIVFYAQIAKENGDFSFTDIANAISDKMVRRHPHVFADGGATESELAEQWEAIKRQERELKGKSVTYLLDTVPNGLPALLYAQKLQKKCATVGFDWPDVAPVLDKVREEMGEIHAELVRTPQSAQAIEEEIGDALFAMVNLARHCQVDADTALRKASLKFATRFNHVEALAKQKGTPLVNLSLDDMEALWQQVKKHSE